MGPFRVCLAIVSLGAAACVSEEVTIAPRPPAHYERLGSAEGEACGSLVFGLIPIEMDSRITRAYAAALASQPGATALLNTELSGDWTYWVFGITHCTAVNGDAIREVAAP